MAFKPTYNQERASRNRNKQQKKQEKLQRREEDAAKRKGLGGRPCPGPTPAPEAPGRGPA